MRFKLIIFIVLFLIPIYSFSQNLLTKAYIDTNNILIGKKINLIIEATTTNEFKVIFPQLTDSIGKLEIISKSEIDTIINKTNNKYVQSIEITSYEEGDYLIEPLIFIYENKINKNVLTQLTDSIKIHFATVEVNTKQDIKDIKSIIEFPLTFNDFVPFIVIIMAFLLLTTIIYIIINKIRKRNKKAEIRYNITIPADIEALESLKKLESEKLWQRKLYKEYYTRITDIIRTFIHRRYGINSFEMTSEEILKDLTGKLISNQAIEILNTIFNISDLAKFARLEPTENENITIIDKTYQFINMTKDTTEKIENTEI